MRIKIIHQRAIAKYIHESFSGTKTSLSDYLCRNSNEIIRNLNLPYDEDAFYYSIGDNNSPEYTEFIDILKQEIAKDLTKAKLDLVEEELDFYLKSTNLGININSGVKNRILNQINDLKFEANPGLSYEKLCANFFKDLGFINVSITKNSNDLGVDITGKFKLDVSPYHPNEIILLAQVKYHEALIDTSYIRKIIGDSLFLKFDNQNIDITHSATILYLISHNGFSNSAKLYANKNGVILLTSEDISNYVASFQKPHLTQSALFLSRTYAKRA